MTAPRFAPCRCGHAKVTHERGALAPQCIAEHCECLRYRPDVPVLRPAAPSPLRAVPAPPVDGPTVEQLLEVAARSEVRTTVRLAERVERDLASLRAAVTTERETAEKQRAERERLAAARARVDELEAALRAARAELRGGTPAPAGSLECPECGQSFDTPQGRGAHRARKHGYRAS